MDLILRGGRVIDPASGLDATCDVGFANGRVAAVAPRIAEKEPHPATDIPGRGQVWVELESLVDEDGAAVDIACDRGDRVCGLGKSARVVLGQFCSTTRQARAFGGLPRPVDDPTIRLALDIAIRSHPVSGSKFRIDLNRSLE